MALTGSSTCNWNWWFQTQECDQLNSSDGHCFPRFHYKRTSKPCYWILVCNVKLSWITCNRDAPNIEVHGLVPAFDFFFVSTTWAIDPTLYLYTNSDDAKTIDWCQKIHELNIIQNMESQAQGCNSATINEQHQQVVYTLMPLCQKINSDTRESQ